MRSDAPADGCGDKFDFRKNCLYCLTPRSCILPCEYDANIPISRRKSAYLVRTDFDKYGRQFTDVIKAKCSERNDRLAHTVKVRVETMIESDLPAADARYHSACRTNLMYNFKKEGNKAPEDPPFLALVDTVSADREKIWNSVELQRE